MTERGLALAGERRRASIEASMRAGRGLRGWQIGLAAGAVGGLAGISVGGPVVALLLLASDGLALLGRG